MSSTSSVIELIGRITSGTATADSLSTLSSNELSTFNAATQAAAANAGFFTGVNPQATLAAASNALMACQIAARPRMAIFDWIDVDGRRETIQPGMQVSAEIKTGDRRAIEFLLSPIMQTLKEAGRER